MEKACLRRVQFIYFYTVILVHSDWLKFNYFKLLMRKFVISRQNLYLMDWADSQRVVSDIRLIFIPCLHVLCVLHITDFKSQIIFGNIYFIYKIFTFFNLWLLWTSVFLYGFTSILPVMSKKVQSLKFDFKSD